MSNLENIEKIIQLMKRDDSIDAPEGALLWSKNIFRTRAAQPQRSIIEQVLAVLKLDLASGKAAFGERSAAGQSRQMLFEAGDNSMDLRIKETEKGLNIQGQILGDGFAGATVQLGELETTTNDLSEFGFVEVPAGTYDLTIRSKEKEIVIKELEISGN